MLEFLAIAQTCAPQIHPNTLAHVVQVESGFNPFAIGVVGAHLARQPRNRDEAFATATWLSRHQFNFSVGLAQVNQANFGKYGLTLETAFEPCRNLRAAAAILTDCYLSAAQAQPVEQRALRDAFSCYYAGNFTTGYADGYVLKVVSGSVRAARRSRSIPTSAPATDPSQPVSALMF